MKNNVGFTLLELMIVIIILGVLAALISGNFITSLKKGRDARRKGDLEQIQRSLEMFYEDKKAYPASITFDAKFCENNPCGATDKVYMQKVPTDPSGKNYRYCTNTSTNQYQLYAYLENSNDLKIISPSYLSSCTADCPNCNYGIAGTDTTP